jgi:DNA polymerase-1
MQNSGWRGYAINPTAVPGHRQRCADRKVTQMLYSDPPARIVNQGTFPFATSVNAVYTIGRDAVGDALNSLFSETTTVGADIETYGLGLAGRRLKCISFGNATRAVVFDPRDPYQLKLIGNAFDWAEWLIWHNAPFDVPNLWMNGIINRDHVRKTIDTLIHCRQANPGERVPKNLEAACDRYMGTGPGGELFKSFKMMGITKKKGFYEYDLDRPIYQQGAASDPLLTYRLYPIVKQAAYDRFTSGHPFNRMSVKGPEAWALVEREQRINRMMTLPRTCKGLRVDFEFLDRYKAENAVELADANTDLEAAGVRPGSGPDLAKVLESEGAMPPDFPRTSKTGVYSMTAPAVENLSHPLARKFVRQKQIQKIGKDYIQKCVDLADDTGRIHPTKNLLAAATGRASANDPPTDQFSGPARGIILFDEGDEGTSVDLSQGEPITIANAARDTLVLDGYEKGSDGLYVQLGLTSGLLPPGTTKAMCGKGTPFAPMYGALKIVVLAQLYGESLAKLSADLGLSPEPYETPNQQNERQRDWEVNVLEREPNTLYPRFAQAKQLRGQVMSAMPKTAEYILKLKGIARQYKKIITISGRILDIPSTNRKGRWTVDAHKGPNYFCQGGQYDLVADSLIGIIDAGLEDAVYLLMHDEIVCSTSASRDIRRILETPSERFCMWAGRTPILRTDIKDLGERWADA